MIIDGTGYIWKEGDELKSELGICWRRILQVTHMTE